MVASIDRGDGRGGDEVEMLAVVVVVMARMMMTAAVGGDEVEIKVVVRLWKVVVLGVVVFGVGVIMEYLVNISRGGRDGQKARIAGANERYFEDYYSDYQNTPIHQEGYALYPCLHSPRRLKKGNKLNSENQY
ncbi:hypothetical protein Tco_1143427 [Tanacetum coccineum]